MSPITPILGDTYEPKEQPMSNLDDDPGAWWCLIIVFLLVMLSAFTTCWK